MVVEIEKEIIEKRGKYYSHDKYYFHSEAHKNLEKTEVKNYYPK